MVTPISPGNYLKKWEGEIRNYSEIPKHFTETFEIMYSLVRGGFSGGYLQKRLTRRYGFKSWTQLNAFHFRLMAFKNILLECYSFQLWMNCGIDSVLWPYWWANWSRYKTVNSNPRAMCWRSMIICHVEDRLSQTWDCYWIQVTCKPEQPVIYSLERTWSSPNNSQIFLRETIRGIVRCSNM